MAPWRRCTCNQVVRLKGLFRGNWDPKLVISEWLKRGCGWSSAKHWMPLKWGLVLAEKCSPGLEKNAVTSERTGDKWGPAGRPGAESSPGCQPAWMRAQGSKKQGTEFCPKPPELGRRPWAPQKQRGQNTLTAAWETAKLCPIKWSLGMQKWEKCVCWD